MACFFLGEFRAILLPTTMLTGQVVLTHDALLLAGVFLGNTLIYWKCKKQNRVAKSSIECVPGDITGLL